MRTNNKANCFPEYFKNFEMPQGAKKEQIKTYRACKTSMCDKESFTPTYEEQGFIIKENQEINDPSVYSLSLYERPKDVKRFANLNSECNKPYKIAKGITNGKYGLCQRTKERKKKSSSHVDYWLYIDATPHKDFVIIENFEKYLKTYNLHK